VVESTNLETNFPVPTASTRLAIRDCYTVDQSGTSSTVECDELHDGQVFQTDVVLDGVETSEPDASVWNEAATGACGNDFAIFTGADLTRDESAYAIAVVLDTTTQNDPVVNCAVVRADEAKWAGTAESISGTYLGIEVGDCFDFPTPESNALELTCTGEHEGEMFVVDAPIGLDVPMTPYPTDAEWDVIAGSLCDVAYQSYTGYEASDEESPLSYTYLMPLEVDWPDVDGRSLSCAVVNYDGTRLVGSAKV
jgi:hypothetical protein